MVKLNLLKIKAFIKNKFFEDKLNMMTTCVAFILVFMVLVPGCSTIKYSPSVENTKKTTVFHRLATTTTNYPIKTTLGTTAKQIMQTSNKETSAVKDIESNLPITSKVTYKTTRFKASKIEEGISITNVKPYITTATKSESQQSYNDVVYSASEFMMMGAIQYDGWKWTYYSERVFPGNALDIPGRHNDNSGYVCDENGYICLASSTLSKGSIVSTPLGKQGRVYDTGCAFDVIDVYVSW